MRSLCKNQLYFYTLAINSLKRKLRERFHYNSITRVKYLGINLVKEVQDLHTQNYKTLPKDTNKGKFN